MPISRKKHIFARKYTNSRYTMKKAYIFPGQGSQFVGMGKDLYESSPLAKSLFEEANAILGFPITEVMFAGDEEALKQTRVTQPAIFLHSVIQRQVLGDAFKPDMVAGHSLGEFSALVSSGVLTFEQGLRLVAKRALILPVGGAFHSSLMKPAEEELAKAIGEISFQKPLCPIYQNVTTTAVTDPEEIKKNLIAQLTAPVKWTQSVQQMIADGATEFYELAPGKVLQGLVKKINKDVAVFSA